MKYNEAMKKKPLKTLFPWILSAVMTCAFLVLIIGASDSVKRGSGFLFIPSNTPTSTWTPTFTRTPTLTPTATATGVPTATLTPLPTFDKTAFLADFFAEVTQTAVMVEFLRTPSVTPTVPDSELRTGMASVNQTDGATLRFIGLATSREDGARGFWIDRNEVSVNAYERCVAAGGCDSYANDASSDLERMPAVNLSRVQAAAYCEWVGMTLPSLQDQRDAAMSGVMTDAEPNIDNRLGQPRPLTEENSDLIGNVWEWTSDDLPDGRAVIAGGSWKTSRHDIEASRDAALNPSESASDVGFRCVRYVY